MQSIRNWLMRGIGLANRNSLACIVMAYVLAVAWPASGIAMRHCALIEWGDHEAVNQFTLPMVLLSVLLFNAALLTSTEQLRGALRRPFPILVGLAANTIVPVLFIVGVQVGLRTWHSAEETQNLFVGLTIVASMPIAGASTVWSQRVRGDLALSLGLVLSSTILSPLITPLIFRILAGLADGIHSEALHGLSGLQTGQFLLGCVVVPSLAGLLIRQTSGFDRVRRIAPALKCANSLILIVVCYANAAVALPQILVEPDWDFLAIVGAATVGLCLLTFASGWVLARILKVDSSRRRSLMFGLGMNNNGSGMVLAASSLSGMPSAIFPVLAYNLVQHLVAGSLHWRLGTANE